MYSITVKARQEDNWGWSKKLTLQEYEEAKRICHQKKKTNLFVAMCMPVRTTSFKNFSKDFFFPTLINHALKIDTIALRIFKAIGAIVADVLTFPIRVITLIPRLIYNAIKIKHPLYQFLKKQEGIDAKILQSHRVYIQLEGEEKNRSIPKSRTLKWVHFNE